MVKLGTYAAVSTVGALGVIYHAFYSREQFYPAMLYLSTSKISLVLLLNMAMVIACGIWRLIKVIFLGSLREAEVERLNEQLVKEIMEILFAMTIFREEFNVSFVSLVFVLLFTKAFHWLAQKRVEYIEITPSVSRLSHARIASFMVLLLVIDSLFLYSSISYLLQTRKASVSLLFAFEYVILATSVVSMFLKYGLYMGDMWMDGQWDNKAVYVFYLELVRDLLILSLYLFFFLTIFVNYGLPLHLVRELYEIVRNFKARVSDFIRYRKVTSNMNERFPDATAEELSRSDATCIICREEMVAAKKLPCGHLFHVHCLRSWLERQQTCPTCRSPVLVPEGGTATPAADHLGQRQQQGGAAQGQGQQSSESGSGLSQSPAPQTAYDQHQARMQAAMAAAAQYGSSFVYPFTGSGTMNWLPMYVPVIPHPAHPSIAAATSRPSPSTGSDVGGTEQLNSGESNAGPPFVPLTGALLGRAINAQLGAMHAMPTSSAILSNLGGHQIPVSIDSVSNQEAESINGASSSQPSDTNAQSAASNLLDLQHAYLKNRIEILQQQLQLTLELQRRLSSSEEQPDMHDRKGKARMQPDGPQLSEVDS